MSWKKKAGVFAGWLEGMGRALAISAALMWGASQALAMPMPLEGRTVNLSAREQPIAAFLQDLMATADIPVSVSASVKGAVNGNFSGPVETVFRNISRAFNLVSYYDGTVLHVYAPQDMSTRTMPLDSATAQRVLRVAREMRLPDDRNTLRLMRGGTLVSSGTRRFIEQVEELARGQQASFGAAGPSAVRVFYLRYAWAQDVAMNFGGRQVALPGVATIVRATMSDNVRSQLAMNVPEQPRGTVPRARESAPSMGGAWPRSVLGAPGANPNQPSAATVAAAYGAEAMQAGGMPSPQQAQWMQQAQFDALYGRPDTSRVEADARLNAVIVRDAPDRMEQYASLIEALDVEPQALEIEATIIDLDTDRMRELGINWRYTKGRTSLLFGRGDESDLLLTPNTRPGDITPLGVGGFLSAVLGNANQFIARINALEQQGAARVVSSPQVMTLSNVEAVFDNSQTFYVRVAGRDEVDLFNVSAGTTLRVTPHVFKDADRVRIKMLVAVEDGSLSPRVVDTLPVVERSAINTQALIFEGESLLIGGITREVYRDDTTKVPFLGDVPVAGALFRNKAQNSARVERMFLISPRLAMARNVPASPPSPLPPPQGPTNVLPLPAPPTAPAQVPPTTAAPAPAAPMAAAPVPSSPAAPAAPVALVAPATAAAPAAAPAPAAEVVATRDAAPAARAATSTHDGGRSQAEIWLP